MKWRRFVGIGLWATGILTTIWGYFFHPALFTPDGLRHFIQQFEGNLWWVYVAVSMLRGVTLVPSMPFVVVGTLLFPHNLALVLTISVIGVCFSAAMIYHFSEWLGLAHYFQSKYDLERHRNLLDRYGFWVVVAWAFFPLAPTDAICYVAGMVKMSFWKFLLAIFIGELLICASVVYATHQIF